ncbi:hypothetical protein [Acinetobacter sp. SEK570]|uniref:hypothetical protein n=1 Tax=unclassified Acinetobacter TaxID=196816 RepID=UPI00399F4E92
MIKQTQTKMFDFSDVGLDFCSGSKNKFPEVFKKMLATGYNPQTAASISITSDQVTLTFGVNHGYVADRVLLVTATGGFSKEVYIDSVTSNTITFTQSVTTGLSGTITTKVASLGWELVYELNHIHIYKFKHFDETDMFARFCFQNATTTGNRNCIAVGIGRTANLSSGVITDSNCFSDLASCATVADATSNIRWDFTNSTARTFDNYTYSQGYSTFGRGVVIGSPYHFLVNYHQNNITSGSYAGIVGVLPFESDYSNINYPLLIAQNNGASTTTTSSGQLLASLSYVGLIRINLHNSDSNLLAHSFSSISFLPTAIEPFNTTACLPFSVYTHAQRQFLGYCLGGIYQACYANSNTPAVGNANSPGITVDVEFTNRVLTHYLRDASGNFNVAWLAMPVEKIKDGS